MAFMISERKPHFKLPSFIEKQRSGRVSDMQQQLGELHGELMRAKEERSRTLEELAELKKMNADSAQSRDKIKLIELQAMKAKDSERQMLDSMVFQTKQLEQTKISFEEAKLEIKKLKESLRKMERSDSISGSCFYKKDGAFESARAQEEKRKLRKELKLALEAEEKSKLAMDDFAIALKEVSSDMNQVKEELAAIESELEKAREGSIQAKSLLLSTEQKLIWALNGCDKAKMEHEDSVSASKVKEKSFLSCMDISEEEITKWRQENSRLNDSWKVAREENAKLREIMKQAVNESISLKDALESARRENSQMKDQLSEKGNDLQKVRQDYESLKVSEAAALDSVRELNILLASASIADSKRASNLSEGRRSTSIFSSGRWKSNNNQILNRRRHSVGEPGMIKISTFDREKSLESNNEMFSSIRNLPPLPSPLFPAERGTLNSDRFEFVQGIEHNDTGHTSHKKKQNAIERLGNALSRRSFHR
ncbi:hypothetical protein KSP39_PZI009949 [Platanthera zijinensis]|uniref:Uncharacterized protein n=1 Tax=Platanthera zijinensis TaxID=2320716 RepID=A0AAP0BHY0_9ASPA